LRKYFPNREVGYYGSNHATYFGEAVPVISVQTVPV